MAACVDYDSRFGSVGLHQWGQTEGLGEVAEGPCDPSETVSFRSPGGASVRHRGQSGGTTTSGGACLSLGSR